MAEALGVAGSVVGIISLGLDLFKEISQYLDDVDARDEDLERARNVTKISQTTLRAVDKAVSRATITDPDAKNAVDDCRASCTAAVERLVKLVDQLKGVKNTGNSGTAKVKQLYTKLKYPFKKQDMEKLEECLINTNSILQNTLSVLLLNTGNDARDTIITMQQKLDSMRISIEDNRILQEKTDKTSNLVAERVQSYQMGVQQLLAGRSDQNIAVQRELGAVSGTVIASDSQQNLVHETTVSGIHGTRAIIPLFCSCRTQRTWRDRGRWGFFVIESETTSTNYHEPECPMSGMRAVKHQRKRVLNFSVPAIQNLWMNAGRISLSFTTSTPGLCLGLNLNWSATVDELSSPVFLMMRTVLAHQDLKREDMTVLLASCLRRLSWCYSNQKASVTDVNQYGQSILQWATPKTIFPTHTSRADNAAQLLQMLVAIPGVYDNWKFEVPFLALVTAGSLWDQVRAPDEIITALVSRSNKSVGHHNRVGPAQYGIWKQSEIIGNSLSVAENLEFGPLSRAILRENQDEVESLLKNRRSCIDEVNYCGESPIHIAIKLGRIGALRAILGYEDVESVERIINTADNQGLYPIDLAAYMEYHHFNGTEGIQRDCVSCKMLELLLQFKCAILQDSLSRGLDRMADWRHPVCQKAVKSLIKALAIRRKELKELALRNLPPEETYDLNLRKPGVLDHNAALVQQFLEARSCHIPTYLKVYDSGESANNIGSIYTLIWDKEMADCAKQSGFYSETMFKDVFRLMARWMSYHDFVSSSWDLASSLFSYVSWMVNHGANLATSIPIGLASGSEGNTTAAHYFMAFLGMNLGSSKFPKYDLDPPLSQAGLDTVFSGDVVDECRCLCSPVGCTPLIKLLEGTILFEGRGLGPHRHMDTVFRKIRRIAGDEEIIVHSWMYSSILRYFTFIALDLRHTCCSLANNMTGPLSEEECREIHEEDSPRLARLEDLVAEFERERADSTEFSDFLRYYWAPKMRVVKQELDNQMLTKEQVRKAEEIGVVWECYRPQRPSCSNMNKSQEEDGLSELERALRELDAIATDPQRPARR